MPDDERSSVATAAPIERSVAVQFELLASHWHWGASTAVLFGVIAASPSPHGLATIVRIVAAWFVAVPLLGAAWAPLIDPSRARRRSAAGVSWRFATSWRWWFALGWRGVLDRCRQAPEVVDAVASMALALAVGALLDAAATVVLLVALLLLGVVWLARGGPPAPTGATRSVLEIFVPAVIGWLALGGAKPVPAAVLVTGGPLSGLNTWLAQNWLVPGLCLAFTWVFAAALMGGQRSALTGPRSHLVMAYLLAVLLLLLSGRSLGAGGVALLFVAQWPFQAALGMGRGRWHWQATQGMALAAMVLAAVSAGYGGG
jgi:hypothetical protein